MSISRRGVFGLIAAAAVSIPAMAGASAPPRRRPTAWEKYLLNGRYGKLGGPGCFGRRAKVRQYMEGRLIDGAEGEGYITIGPRGVIESQGLVKMPAHAATICNVSHYEVEFPGTDVPPTYLLRYLHKRAWQDKDGNWTYVVAVPASSTVRVSAAQFGAPGKSFLHIRHEPVPLGEQLAEIRSRSRGSFSNTFVISLRA